MSSDPDLPKDPAEYRPKPLMGPSFWIMLVFGLVCVLAGAGVAMLLPRLLPPPRPAPVATPPAPTPSAAPTPPAGQDEVARLNARIAALENAGARSSEAASAAMAAAGLIEAAQGSRPFGAEFAALRAAAPDLPELARLARLAAQGAPSRAALAASFPEYAAQAASRAREPGKGARLSERIAYAASRIVSVRRVDDVGGAGPDARLARAEAALARGEIPAALAALDGLPPGAQAALAPWRAEAERRAELDGAVVALRRHAAEIWAAQVAPAPGAGPT
jgi:hypothetical protein